MTTRAETERKRKRPAANVLAAVMRAHWAITPDALRTIVAIAQRENPSPEVIEAMRGEPLRNTFTVTERAGIATIPVRGPMVRYADLFTRISGATSYEDLATDFRTAMDDPRIKAIIFDLDTPGGEVNGCFEFARQVYAARGVKPIIAYVSNWACSGGYELAAACDEIVIFEAAMLGSIGVQACYIDDSKAMAEAGLREIVFRSSNASKKNVDPATQEGADQIQAILDGLEAVFHKDLARFRGTTVERVDADFGQGEVFVGQEVIDRGMADRISDYEALHQELLERDTTPSGAFVIKARAVPSTTSTQEASVETKDQTAPAPGATAEPPKTKVEGDSPAKKDEEKKDGETGANKKVEETDDEKKKDGESDEQYGARMRSIGAKAESKRVAGIRALGKPGEEATVQACIDDATCTVEQAAVRLRQAEANAGKTRLANLKADDAGPHAPNAATPTDASPEAAARKSVALFHELTTPKARA